MSEHYSRDNTRRETLQKTTALKIRLGEEEPASLWWAIAAWILRRIVPGVKSIELDRGHLHEIEQVDRESFSRSIPSEQREQLTKDRVREVLAENHRIHEAKRLAEGESDKERHPASPEELVRAISQLEAKIHELREKGHQFEVPDYRPPGTDPDEPRP